ncbi:hypothetical protein EMQU_3013 (plasmid) [Enterococcus mundtii QU 25]|nr:hypothetical protein EMQU_3013 [Enterococcus mundtii QU 25]
MKTKILFTLSPLFIFLLFIFNVRNAEAVTITKIEDSLNQIGNYYYQNELAGKKLNGDMNSIKSPILYHQMLSYTILLIVNHLN